MLITQTLEQLHQLKLFGMAQAFKEQQQQPPANTLSFEERLGLLVDREALERENRRLKRLLKQAKLRYLACIEDIDYRHVRGLEKNQLASLITCDFIRQHQHVIFTGPTGCGKSFLACALGHQACRQGMSVRYLRVSRLLDMLHIAHADGSYAHLLSLLAKTDLLILDDFGLDQLSSMNRQDLLEIVEDRSQLKSLIITSQLEIGAWHAYLGEPILADAILDRILHASHKFELSGESLRRPKKVDGSGSLEV
jgi:DNA replication protein DnaC